MQNKLPTDMPKTQNLVYYLSVSKTKPHSKGYKEEKKKQPHSEKERAGTPMREIEQTQLKNYKNVLGHCRLFRRRQLGGMTTVCHGKLLAYRGEQRRGQA